MSRPARSFESCSNRRRSTASARPAAGRASCAVRRPPRRRRRAVRRRQRPPRAPIARRTGATHRMIRKLELLIVAVVLVVAAFSTAEPFLFYLLYLAILVIGGSYVLVRLGLSDPEAGHAGRPPPRPVGGRERGADTLPHNHRVPQVWVRVPPPPK